MATKTTMGETISNLRKKNNMTQTELANKMGVTDKAVSKWERDLSCPDISSIPQLAETLGIPINELLNVKGSMENNKISGDKIDKIFDLVLKAVAVAMGVAVVTLSALKQIEPSSAITLLGIGLTCCAIALLKENKK
ncbi:helix-turn-helix domain-containing protein [Alkaliphilus peptidifermentans]|uniref:Helix-turn-helix n=1 Tax=Alkaliphilus peptidifermentans DSM 18978 TaxID=1120976 RepID=A0A1G5GUG7_9FIRM|nr:helix-turn-helix transcriptional regulator [Alkaliphilus peptidifermentans]SCY54810.1 Helix-turn-helix [Alkaliphilus peptidifermentans DSM 18978]